MTAGRSAALTGWSWDEVLPVFMRSEHYHRTAEGHGTDGEMLVERQRLHWPILDAVREAAEEIGIPKTEDFNLGDNEGSGLFRGDAALGHSLERGAGVPVARGAEAAEPENPRSRAGDPAGDRRRAGHRRRV